MCTRARVPTERSFLARYFSAFIYFFFDDRRQKVVQRIGTDGVTVWPELGPRAIGNPALFVENFRECRKYPADVTDKFTTKRIQYVVVEVPFFD